MIFISYSHADRSVAERLATSLREAGQDVWIDQWEILPGDSLIQKIFEEGLADATAFLVLLSGQSVDSAWVQEELDHATIKRIEGTARVIPVLLESIPVPEPLRTLFWVDLREGYDEGVRAILNALEGVRRRPERGQALAHLENLPDSVAGLSTLATMVANYILERVEPDRSSPPQLRADTLAEELSLSPDELNDAVDELAEYGLVVLYRELGSAPFEFVALEPTYALFLHFADFLSYDPRKDAHAVLVAVGALGKATATELEAQTGLSHGRLNRAVDLIGDYGWAEVKKWLGTRPFHFGEVRATRRTRQMAAERE